MCLVVYVLFLVFAGETFLHDNKLLHREPPLPPFFYSVSSACFVSLFFLYLIGMPPSTSSSIHFPALFLTPSLFLSVDDESGSSKGSKIFASVPRLISFPNGRYVSMAADRNGGLWDRKGIDEWVEGLIAQEIDRYRKELCYKKKD